MKTEIRNPDGETFDTVELEQAHVEALKLLAEYHEISFDEALQHGVQHALDLFIGSRWS